jgi:hypothetical protein
MKSRKSFKISLQGFLAMGIAFTLTVTSCGEKKNRVEEAPAKEQAAELAANISFSDGATEQAFHNYQEMRIALVKSDVEKVKAAATNLAGSFSGDGDELKQTAIEMANAESLEKQRELFSELTATVEPMFKEALSGGIIYKQFCPMVFEGEGGYWISTEDEILNPYYGEKMLKCGKVVNEIK